jgi:hypothetical protein
VAFSRQIRPAPVKPAVETVEKVPFQKLIFESGKETPKND